MKRTTFSAADFKKMGAVLGVPPKKQRNHVRFEINKPELQRKLVLEIYPLMPIGSRKGILISVYTMHAHLQLHFCSGYVVSSVLDEVTFIGEHKGMLCGLIVEREGGCSLYANVDRRILSGDFTQLGPEVMLSGIALSLTESILPVSSPGRTSRKR